MSERPPISRLSEKWEQVRSDWLSLWTQERGRTIATILACGVFFAALAWTSFTPEGYAFTQWLRE